MCFINDFLFCREKIIINDFVLIIFLCRMFFYIISYVFPSQTPHYDCAAMYGWGGGGFRGPSIGPHDAERRSGRYTSDRCCSFSVETCDQGSYVKRKIK